MSKLFSMRWLRFLFELIFMALPLIIWAVLTGYFTKEFDDWKNSA
jgi:hypothetical protein